MIEKNISNQADFPFHLNGMVEILFIKDYEFHLFTISYIVNLFKLTDYR
jgi:hypothetical protein